MKKITILALHLGYGGIEKAISSLANNLCDSYEMEIISTYKLFDKPAFFIDKRVKIKYLMENLKPNRKELSTALKNFNIKNIFKETKKILKILFLKKKTMVDAIKNCDSDIIISTRDIHNKWLGKYGNLNIIKIGWEHSHHNNNKKYIKKIVNSVKSLNYFVLVSSSLKEFYEKKLESTKCECIFIPNSLDAIPEKVSNLDTKNIISVGRLSKEKGYTDLIEVFKYVNLKYPDWNLNIIGDGSEREKIEFKIKEQGLENNVFLHGFRDKDYINKQLEQSSIYVMCSFTECFPIVLLEAFSYGIPCIAFDSANGAKEIISDNWDGYLVPNRDKEKMAKRIISLIKDENRRIIMGDNAYKSSFKYSKENITKMWINLFEKK